MWKTDTRILIIQNIKTLSNPELPQTNYTNVNTYRAMSRQEKLTLVQKILIIKLVSDNARMDIQVGSTNKFWRIWYGWITALVLHTIWQIHKKDEIIVKEHLRYFRSSPKKSHEKYENISWCLTKTKWQQTKVFTYFR